MQLPSFKKLHMLHRVIANHNRKQQLKV